ncbi:DUF222 domain-containing protein [Arthrobacter sp. NPDC058130]|uniref:DUF222 domain-containing protein n=1 Tax=Arthrobacter sp. NPDC058130 TaxID=3346353 RepID=UPI0036EE79EE
MEVVGGFIEDQADRPGSAMPLRLPQSAAVPDAAGGSVDGSVAAALELLRASTEAAVEDVARFDFFQASDFAAGVEDLSRIVEYLQIIGAARVDRTRREAALAAKAPGGWGSEAEAGSAGGWLTGWNQEPSEVETVDTKPEDESEGVHGVGSEAGADPGGNLAAAAAMVADDGCRNAAEFLQARLRIGASEAKRRLRLGTELLPRTGLAGRTLPPARPVLAAAVSEGIVASRTATLIAMSLDRVGHVASPESVDAMEHALTMTAVGNDPDFLPHGPAMDRCPGPGRSRAIRGGAAPAPGRFHPETPARPAPSGNLLHHRPVRTVGHSDECGHQSTPGCRSQRGRRRRPRGCRS